MNEQLFLGMRKGAINDRDWWTPSKKIEQPAQGIRLSSNTMPRFTDRLRFERMRRYVESL
ncbi:hypothetical protein Q4F19_08000 [Sphingomonas sp. BIUV-7]|uniref:Uncharacterized protein n=1 Tax=Sphingomonas natans TaxID=3063330 RepID=A0ABT8Y7L8_9SPHN|nr:hypothetical protein [Sphingomonas sp. BIUV-7]MDO6414322.1 hypothetical protein [Sphingomonas sp. BIUV-7]